MSYKINTPTELSAYLEVTDFNTINRVFIDQKHIYMALNKSMGESYRPVVDYYIERCRFDIATSWVSEMMPDSSQKLILLSAIMDAEAQANSENNLPKEEM